LPEPKFGSKSFATRYGTSFKECPISSIAISKTIQVKFLFFITWNIFYEMIEEAVIVKTLPHKNKLNEKRP